MKVRLGRPRWLGRSPAGPPAAANGERALAAGSDAARPAARRRGVRASMSALAQLVLGYTPPPAAAKPGMVVEGPFRRRRRRPWVPVLNLGRLVLGGAVASWLRNFGMAAPALGSIALLLLLGGALTVSGFAAGSLLTDQAAEASILRVYLSEQANDDDVARLRRDLAADPHVRSVTYVSKEQALARARQRPGLADLATASDSNPFPASLDVQVDQPASVAGVAQAAALGPGVDKRRATSYEPGTYDRLRRFTLIGLGIAGGFGLLVLFITYAISSNSIRAVVLARRDELVTMQLVGASPWLVRARLGVEGALTGGLAGVLAGLVLFAAGAALFFGEQQLFVRLLPGVSTEAAVQVVGTIAAVGVAMGAVSALFAFRRLKA